jgi:hypothetical protein
MTYGISNRNNEELPNTRGRTKRGKGGELLSSINNTLNHNTITIISQHHFQLCICQRSFKNDLLATFFFDSKGSGIIFLFQSNKRGQLFKKENNTCKATVHSTETMVVFQVYVNGP